MAFLSVAYRETVTRRAEARGKYVRQGPDKPRYGDVALRVEPLARGGGFEMVNAIEPGRVPASLIADIVQGVYETAEEGIIGGFPLVDLRVVLLDGTFHDIHSTPLAFRIAASIAMRDAVTMAGPVILAPIARVELPVPRSALQGLQREVHRMKGFVVSSEEYDHDRFRVKAVVGLADLMEARGGGRAEVANGAPGFDWHESFRLQLSHYEQAPPELQKRLVEEFRRSMGEEKAPD